MDADREPEGRPPGSFIASAAPESASREDTMADLSKQQFSLREVVGTVAPGAMVLLSVLYVVSRIPGVGGVRDIGSGWDALLILFVISYGAGTLLTSLTEAVFAAVTKLGAT